MRSLLARLERLERHFAEAASAPLPVEKPPWTEEDDAEAFRIFIELSATAPPPDEAARAETKRRCEEALRAIK